MTHAVAIDQAVSGGAVTVFDEDTRASIFNALQLQASYMAGLEHTAARAIELGDLGSALEDIERMAAGIKESLRSLANVVIEVDARPLLSLVKEDRHALAQN